MIKFKLEAGVKLPKYETLLAAGFDVTANSVLKMYNGVNSFSDSELEFYKRHFNH